MNLSTPTVHMGLPSPGTDFANFSLDLNQFLVSNPTATFFMQVESNQYTKFGVYPKDILVLDRSLTKANKPQVYQFQDSFRLLHAHQKPQAEAIFWGTVVGIVRKP